jgi:hypothetical protein
VSAAARCEAAARVALRSRFQAFVPRHHVAIELGVLSQIDLTHPAGSDLVDNLVVRNPGTGS